MMYDPHMEALAAVATALFLLWGWRQARKGADESNRRAAEHRANPKPRPSSSWDGSAEQQQLHAAGEIRRWSSQPPY